MSDFASRGKEVVGIVPIRAGSKGLPGKNTHLFAGKPLYLRAVEQALRVAPHCIVTTDIEQVLAMQPPDGCTVLRRPPGLCADDTPMDPVLKHAFEATGLTDGVAILLQATSPLREDADITEALALLSTNQYDLVMSVCDADRGVLKYGKLQKGRFLPLSRPEDCFTNRQDLPVVTRPNGAVYVFDIESYLRRGGLASECMGATLMPPERSIDIDTIDDLLAAERLAIERAASVGVLLRTQREI